MYFFRRERNIFIEFVIFVLVGIALKQNDLKIKHYLKIFNN